LGVISMKLDGRGKLLDRAVVSLYGIGVGVSALTQLSVMVQRGAKVYVSLLWAILYPVQLFLTGALTTTASAFHVSVGDSTAIGVAVATSSALFGTIPAAFMGLAKADNRLARCIGIGALAILALLAVLWGKLPRVL
jgi:hypothetical protein